MNGFKKDAYLVFENIIEPNLEKIFNGSIVLGIFCILAYFAYISIIEIGYNSGFSIFFLVIVLSWIVGSIVSPINFKLKVV